MTKRNRKPAIIEQEVFKPFVPTELYDVYHRHEDELGSVYYRVLSNHPYICTKVERFFESYGWRQVGFNNVQHLIDEYRVYRNGTRIKLVAKNVRFNK